MIYKTFVFVWFLIFTTITPCVFSQSVSLDFVKKIESFGHVEVRDVAIDSVGNYFVLGEFRGMCDFNPSSTTNYLTADGVLDAFVLKLNKKGEYLWAIKFGGYNDEVIGKSIALNDQGDIYITGEFNGNPWFSQYSTGITSVGGTDVFVIKISRFGGLLWAKTIGGTSAVLVTNISIGKDQNPILTGSFSGKVDFKLGSGTDFVYGNPGYFSMYSLKINPSGNKIWINTIIGLSNISVASVHVDKNELMYITGNAFGVLDFNPGSGVDTLSGYDYIYVMKTNTNGDYFWAKNIVSSYSEYPKTVYADDNANVIVGGSFSHALSFDPSSAQHVLTPIGGQDAFIWKLDRNGDFKWVKKFGGTGNDYVSKLVVDNIGNIYSTGSFRHTVDFDPGASVSSYTSNGSEDVFIHKLDSNGNFMWVETTGGIFMEKSNLLIFDKNRKIIHGGDFGGTVDFDPEAGNYNLTQSNGMVSVYFRKLNQCTAKSNDFQSECKKYTWMDGVTYTTSNYTAESYFNSSLGCDSVVSLKLDILNADTGVTRNGLTLKANAKNANYQWINCDGSIVSGESDSVFHVTKSGSYALVVQENGCLDTSSCFTFLHVSVDEANRTESMAVYPNPTSNVLQVKIESGQFNGKVEWVVYNAQGEQVYPRILSSIQNKSELILDVSNLKAGLYFIRVKRDGFWLSRSFVKF